MQRIIKTSLPKPISLLHSLKKSPKPLLNPTKFIPDGFSTIRNHRKYFCTNPIRELDANNYFSSISMLEHSLDDAVAYKHNSKGRDQDLYQCREALDELLQELKDATATKTPRISQLEKEVKAYEKEFHARVTSEIVLGFVLLIQKFKNDDTKKSFSYSFKKYSKENPNISNISSYYSVEPRYSFEDICNDFKTNLMHILVGKEEISLLRWMDFQIQMMHEDAKDLDTYYNEGFPTYMRMSTPEMPRSHRKFLQISTLTRHFDKLVESKHKLTNESQITEAEEEENNNIMRHEMIYNTIVKIAEARDKLSQAFEDKKENCDLEQRYSSYVPKTISLDHVPKEINEVSEMFEDLFVKLPVNYDMTLKQWLELKLQAKLHEYIFEARVPTE